MSLLNISVTLDHSFCDVSLYLESYLRSQLKFSRGQWADRGFPGIVPIGLQLASTDISVV